MAASRSPFESSAAVALIAFALATVQFVALSTDLPHVLLGATIAAIVAGTAHTVLRFAVACLVRHRR